VFKLTRPPPLLSLVDYEAVCGSTSGFSGHEFSPLSVLQEHS